MPASNWRSAIPSRSRRFRPRGTAASGRTVAGSPRTPWSTSAHDPTATASSPNAELDDHALLAVVVLAALPSAQNVFNYAQRYEVGEVVARDTVFLTTLGCLPALFACALLLG
ncbi:hypothetical protein [Cellulosimicrobium composti]|uniref:hypothetical protein n=1 Tax=Cellulosimicrobium composti TaxID=2672572 RepID=UPI001CEDDCA7|nr:hypothetical protein [Cellulosimicrobium composti]